MMLHFIMTQLLTILEKELLNHSDDVKNMIIEEIDLLAQKLKEFVKNKTVTS